MIAGKPFALARDASDLVGECYELIGRRAELASPSITGRTDAYQDLLLKVTPPRLPRSLVANRQAEQVDGEGMHGAAGSSQLRVRHIQHGADRRPRCRSS